MNGDNALIVREIEDIPEFTSEAEESEYWQNHTFSEPLWDQRPITPDNELPPPRPRYPLDDGSAW